MLYLEEVKKQLLSPDSSLEVIDENGNRHTAKDLRSRIEAYMAHISEWNLEIGSPIALFPRRTVNWMCFMYASMLKGHIPLLLDAEMKDDLLEKIIANEAILYDVHERSIGNLHIRALPEPLISDEYDGLLDKTPTSQNQPLLTVHTSGTTGTPKKITYSNENISWAVREYAHIYNLKTEKTILFSLPYHYCYSVIPCCLVPFALGKRVVISPEGCSAVDVADLIQSQQIQILVVNPVFYTELSRINLQNFDFSSLTICDSGGESIPPPVVRRIKAQSDVLITEGYGLTETTSLTHFLLPDDQGVLRIGSVGRACRGVETRIVGNDGKEVEAGAIGELHIRGAMVASYDTKESDTHDGWLATGDLFYEDKDGYFYFVSRKKDVPDVEAAIVLGASRATMELLDIPSVKDASYIFSDKIELVIFVVSEKVEDQMVVADRIKATFEKYGHHSIELRFVASLPRTSTGKVKKREL